MGKNRKTKGKDITLSDCRETEHGNFLSGLSDGASKRVNFNSRNSSHSNGVSPNNGMHKSPSTNTLNRMERENYVLWWWPRYTVWYCIREIYCLISDFVLSLFRQPIRLLAFSFLVASALGLYYVEGPHHAAFRQNEEKILWCCMWVWLGILSSVGFGTGLHTFVLYLGPHIAKVTLAAYECNSLDFPEPPYPDDVTCPTNGKAGDSAVSISLWNIISKVRLEAFMWGMGTAIGELPPYFMAKAARLSGEEPDDEEYREFRAYMQGQKSKKNKGLIAKTKLMLEKYMDSAIRQVGFLCILLFASIPNPLFDLAGLTCGHFNIPFLTFFGATLIGKAVIKMHLQMLFVVLAFSEHHVENLVGKLKLIPHVGEYLQAPLKEFLNAQKIRLHRKPTDPITEQASSKLELAMQILVIGMVGWFIVSLIHSLAQRYHKRLCDSRAPRKSPRKTQ